MANCQLTCPPHSLADVSSCPQSLTNKFNQSLILIIQNGERNYYTQDILSSGLRPSDAIVRLCCLDLRVPGSVFIVFSGFKRKKIVIMVTIKQETRDIFAMAIYDIQKCSHPTFSLFIMMILIIRPVQTIKFQCQKFILQS